MHEGPGATIALQGIPRCVVVLGTSQTGSQQGLSQEIVITKNASDT
jgi:hypothetical protein